MNTICYNTNKVFGVCLRLLIVCQYFEYGNRLKTFFFLNHTKSLTDQFKQAIVLSIKLSIFLEIHLLETLLNVKHILKDNICMYLRL